MLSNNSFSSLNRDLKKKTSVRLIFLTSMQKSLPTISDLMFFFIYRLRYLASLSHDESFTICCLHFVCVHVRVSVVPWLAVTRPAFYELKKAHTHACTRIHPSLSPPSPSPTSRRAYKPSFTSTPLIVKYQLIVNIAVRYWRNRDIYLSFFYYLLFLILLSIFYGFLFLYL